MLNSLHFRNSHARLSSSDTSSRSAAAPPAKPLMNPTTASAKPKAKFSSRNLSAVFKAPLRTKPLLENATGPQQRPNSRMLVLGRAAASPPAPLNTPSLKRESQVHDVHVSLVPAGSNWAESAEKQQKPETPEPAPAPTNVVAPPEKPWTPESVAEHLHTGGAPARPKAAAESSGRWGDDAVEHDIVRNNVRRQMQKEREFPDLKEAVEETQTHHGGQGHAPAADRSRSMGPQQSEQHHGRATGRWAHFNEQEEVPRSIQDDRWSRDRYGRGEDDRWSRERYSRYDDGCGRQHRPDESSNDVVSPVPNDSHTHFSRSDARFDMVASGDRDRVLSHSPHRMDWSSGQLARRDGRSSSPACLNGPEDSRFRNPQLDRSLTQSPAPVSPSPAPKTPPMTADVAPARATSWRNVPTPDQGWGRAEETPRRAANAWSNDEEPTTPVAAAAESNTESSSNSSASTSPSPPQQVQLLKRPKMLFDPKTGGMVNANDTAAPGKRQAGGRNGGNDRETANAAAASGSTFATERSDGKAEGVFKAATKKSTKGVKTEVSEESPTTAVVNGVSTASATAANSMQESVAKDTGSVSETPSSVFSSAASKGSNEKCAPKRATTKQAAQVKTGSRVAKPARDSRCAATQQAQQRRGSQETAASVREGSRASNGKTTERGKRNISTRNDRRDVGSSNPTQRRPSRKVEVTTAQPSKVDPSEDVLLKQIADDSSGGVVVLTDGQAGIEVSPEDEGFETVKSRRTVLTEKKRQRLASTETADEENSRRASVEEHADGQSKGEQVQENFGMAPKVVDTQRASKPRGKAANSRRNAEQATKDRKPRPKQPKQSARTSEPKSKLMPAKAAASGGKASSAEAKQPPSPAKPTEQVAGEAPAESLASKKRSQYVKVASTTGTKREQKPRGEKQAQGISTRRPSDRKVSASTGEGNAHKQEPTKRVVEKASSTKPRGPAAKSKPKQARQVYVVKTPAPASGATSTAA
ncbi:hypothetical protein PHYPSEUDO_006519 [Phytophthora pseudosyringae]|uniref:BAT2 N-terminal domain-containing protein n=1 Tax=Phytophthora pseudosyringae TaxID=221518 RepID=A0A8T1VLF2_9STRA|nr:hypothetical protein PHYPSEUDO_006519 [Phytophthora pseudosyringae]